MSASWLPELLGPLTCRQRQPILLDPKPIGLVGAGNITRTHVPGYQWAGLEARAICDIDEAKARERATELGIPVAAASLDHLLEIPEIAFIDVNFPGSGRLEAVSKIAAAGKHILVQKPLADDWRTARELVDICRRAGVVLAVNHNARFNPVYRTVRNVVVAGVIGEPYFALHHLSANQDGMPHHGRWMTDAPRYQILQFGVHHIDQVCWWFGRLPRAVTAVNTRKPGQQFRGDMLATLAFDFGDTAGATLLEFNALHATRPYEAEFEVHGTRGMIAGSFDGKILVRHEELPEGEAIELHPEGKWFPYGFGEVMADLQNAVAEKREPEVSGEANLGTMSVIEGCYRSIAERRTINAEEFLGAVK